MHGITSEDLHVNDGLMEYNSRLRWPGIDFTAYSNGPSSNMDYTDITTGTRTYLRWFSFGAGSNISNFLIDIEKLNTNFVNTSTSLTLNNAYLEILVPNTTTVNTSLSFKDAYQNYLDEESAGCFVQQINVNQREYTLGTRSTFTSNGIILIKLTMSNTWIGEITKIEVSI